MKTSRRQFLKAGGAAASLLPFMFLQEAMAKVEFGANMEEAMDISSDAHVTLANFPGIKMFGNEQIVMLVYPGMTMLDLVGPQYFFSSMMGAKVHLVTMDEQIKPIMGDTGFAIVPTMSYKDAPKEIDVLFVPGGTTGTLNVMKDNKSIDFIQDAASRAKLITSVCTGSLILGRAGLLKDKKATSHWAGRDMLVHYGATPINQRVVSSGNIVTGAGVSAGIDFAISILAKLRGDNYAKAIQLQAEYSPQPQFEAGTPEESDPELYEAMHEMFAPMVVQFRDMGVRS
jgi:putative intracellular protease/amidase